MPLVLTHKDSSGYDDEPWSRYHFPSTYRKLLEASEGEWFVYYEPRRGDGRESYVALGRLGAVRPDPRTSDHFYVDVSNYEPFAEVVPWRAAHGEVMEGSLLKEDGTTNRGQFQRSVRRLPMTEFNVIVARGFAGTYDQEPIATPFAADEPVITERPLVEVVVQRKIRDRAFMTNVRRAYGQTCAFTGLKVVNGGGWTEMEAAHIRPVESDGPDTVRNGLALSRTIHALFDRGFLSLTNEFEIITARNAPLPEQLLGLLVRDRVALVPEDPAMRPHRAFLEFHRQRVFKDKAA
jgi:putative restriction endonuclease